jgi:hypothetical protein
LGPESGNILSVGWPILWIPLSGKCGFFDVDSYVSPDVIYLRRLVPEDIFIFHFPNIPHQETREELSGSI